MKVTAEEIPKTEALVAVIDGIIVGLVLISPSGGSSGVFAGAIFVPHSLDR
jgi:ammonia channel protein AmtB